MIASGSSADVSPISPAVAADGFHRAFLERGQAGGFFGGIERLMEHKAAVLGLVAFEVARGRSRDKDRSRCTSINVETARGVFRYSSFRSAMLESRFQSIGPPSGAYMSRRTVRKRSQAQNRL